MKPISKLLQNDENTMQIFETIFDFVIEKLSKEGQSSHCNSIHKPQSHIFIYCFQDQSSASLLPHPQREYLYLLFGTEKDQVIKK